MEYTKFGDKTFITMTARNIKGIRRYFENSKNVIETIKYIGRDNNNYKVYRVIVHLRKK